MDAGDQLGQVARFLRRGAVAPDLVDAQVRMGAVRQADCRGSTRHFLHGDAMGEIAHAGAAPFLLDRDAKQAKFAHLRPQVARERIAAVDLGSARRYAVAGESGNGPAQPVEVFAETEIEACPGVGDRSHRLITSNSHPAKSATLRVASAARPGGS